MNKKLLNKRQVISDKLIDFGKMSFCSDCQFN